MTRILSVPMFLFAVIASSGVEAQQFTASVRSPATGPNIIEVVVNHYVKEKKKCDTTVSYKAGKSNQFACSGTVDGYQKNAWFCQRQTVEKVSRAKVTMATCMLAQLFEEEGIDLDQLEADELPPE